MTMGVYEWEVVEEVGDPEVIAVAMQGLGTRRAGWGPGAVRGNPPVGAGICSNGVGVDDHRSNSVRLLPLGSRPMAS